MHRITPVFVLTALLFSQPLAAAAGDDIQVVDASVRLVPPVSSTTAAFMKLYNPGDDENLLVAASTSIARTTELHMHSQDNGVMRMRHIPHIHLPPHSDVRLQKGGLHLMLFGLKRPLTVGEKIPFELEFADGSRKTIEAEVAK